MISSFAVILRVIPHASRGFIICLYSSSVTEDNSETQTCCYCISVVLPGSHLLWCNSLQFMRSHPWLYDCEYSSRYKNNSDNYMYAHKEWTKHTCTTAQVAHNLFHHTNIWISIMKSKERRSSEDHCPHIHAVIHTCSRRCQTIPRPRYQNESEYSN